MKLNLMFSIKSRAANGGDLGLVLQIGVLGTLEMVCIAACRQPFRLAGGSSVGFVQIRQKYIYSEKLLDK